MNKILSLFVFVLLFTGMGMAQEEKKPDQELDSLERDLQEEGIFIDEGIRKKNTKVNPLAPSKAAFYSAVFPGLGQIYNKRYWKVPIVYIALGIGINQYIVNNDNYNLFRDAFKRRRAGFTDDIFFDINMDNAPGSAPDFSDQVLQNQQERFQRSRDLALLITVGLYVLNVIDANVDAHLKQFNISEDLSMDMEFNPYINLDPITANPVYGMALTVKF
ncbi:DUF5683 domain-containing protein [Spongiimicrobium salis]|uniref:DUF5683 domain-containing protein n=1 Tax=Spongiimicrobium salis TaxID=1667022 RepID=UPI00374D8F80